MIGAATLVVAGAAVLTVFLWLRTYAPLAATRPFTPGPALGADVEPTFGSGGKTVFIPSRGHGTFETTVTIHNAGRFAVTVTGLVAGRGALAPASLGDPVHPGDVGELRLDPHDSASVVIRWGLHCAGSGDQFSADRVRLRYRYLSAFTRTAAVELPFAVTLRCSGAPPASP
jgi:hypothetical protein